MATAYLGDGADLEAVSCDELMRRLETGDVLVIDARPAAEYRAGHIPTARSIPVDDLDDRLAELLAECPADGEVVAYCRGPYCAFADRVVRAVRERGRRARRLDVGLPEWRRTRLPVEAA